MSFIRPDDKPGDVLLFIILVAIALCALILIPFHVPHL